MKQIATKVSFYFTFIFAMLFGLAFSGYSQSVWVDEPNGESQVGIDFRIPSLNNADADFPVFALYVYSNIVLNNNITLQLDLPVSHYTNGGGEANAAIGNPYAGIQLGGANSSTKFDLGVRLPLNNGSNSRALTTGLATENYKVGAFFPDVLSIISNIHYRYNDSSGLIVKLGGGPEVVIPDGGDGELFVKYYGQLLYNQNDFTFGGGFTGQWFATSDAGSFSDQARHNFGLVGSYDFDRITTGAYIEIPLDDQVNDFLNYTVGLNLAFNF